MRLLAAVAITVALGAPSSMLRAQTVDQSFAALDRGDFASAYTALRKRAEAGHPNARALMARLFGAAPVAPPASARGMDAAAPAVAPRPAPRPRASGLPDPLTPDMFRRVDMALARIGRDLFFDPILSGNRDVACASCHHPSLASGDGVSLGLGTGAAGLGADRGPAGPHPADTRIPRNAPALWNLGARDVRALFHDGRVELAPDAPGRLLTPQGPLGYMQLDSVVAAQALFPVLSAHEMAGQPGENPIADAVADRRVHGDTGAWGLLAARVDAVAGYHRAFASWRGQDGPVRMGEIANAIGAFIDHEFRAHDTPFDRYLREQGALSPQAGEGMRLFYGKAGCAACHSGPLLSDQRFHAMGEPPIGPGKEVDDDGYTRDRGRGAVTGAARDAYAFRTPMLRNVTRTGPWGHAGAFAELRAFLNHHVDPVAGLDSYRPQAVLPQLASADGDYAALSNRMERARVREAAARTMDRHPPPDLDAAEIDMLLAFLAALEDDGPRPDALGVPESLPSGLPVPRR